MDEILQRVWDDLIGRLHGPLTFRLLLQPIVAMSFAVRDGYRDAMAGRPPYFWAVFTDAGHRAELLREGWKAVAKVYVFAVILDVVYQIIVFRWVYPGESLLVAALLAFVPYILFRGPINRVVRLFL